jgi:hypothetical protein
VRRRSQQIVHYAPDVLQTETCRIHRVGVAHSLRILARVGALRTIGSEAQPGCLFLLARPGV